MGRFIVKDTFYKKAKKEGFRARSAYKLDEIQQRFHIIKKGDRVLDLGAAPGSWLQAESALIGDQGTVIGLDILPVTPLGLSNVVLKQADIRETQLPALLAEFGIMAFDVITCDIAPNLSGIRDVDNANIRDIFGAVLRVVKEGLKKNGSFIIKVFFGEDLKQFKTELSDVFGKVTIFKPTASRDVSSEVYLVCTGKRQ